MAVDLFKQLQSIREQNEKEGVLASVSEPVQQSVETTNVPAKSDTVSSDTSVPKFKFSMGKSASVPATVLSPTTNLPTTTQSPAVPAVIKSTAVVVGDLLDVDIDTFNKGSENYTADAMAQIQGALAMLRDNLEDAKLVGQSVRNIMLSMQEAPELKDLIQPEDIGLMVRGLQRSYGVVITKRSEKTSKAAGKVSLQKEVDDAFADIEF